MQLFNTRLELIKSQKHLPYIPSKDEINSNGLQISETISGLVRNIEELYLYIEQMEKRIQLLEEENKQLKEKIKTNNLLMKNIFIYFLLIIVSDIIAQDYQSLRVKEEYDLFSTIMVNNYSPQNKYYTKDFDTNHTKMI